MLQVPKLPEFQKFFGRRYRSLPVCCKVPSYQSSRSFLVADTDLCLYVASSQVTRVSEVFWSQIPISACMLQVPKLPEFQKFFGRRYRSLPVCCKFPSYQSFRSFLVADTDLCLSVAKFPSYQSSRSFLVADTDLCLSVATDRQRSVSATKKLLKLW